MNPNVLADGLMTVGGPPLAKVGGLDAETVLAWLGTAGGSAIVIYALTQFVAVVQAWWKRRDEKVETRNATLEERVASATEERDREYRKRQRADARAACEARNARRLWDYAARLRRLLIVHGIEIDHEEPTLEQCELIEDEQEDEDGDPPRKRKRGRRRR